MISEEDAQWITNNLKNNNDNLNENSNGSCKHTFNFKLNENKLKVIAELNTYNYRSPIYKVTLCLQEIFKECDSKSGHWAYIAEHYPPRAINRVIGFMIKNYGDWETLQNPARMFTFLIKFRKQKRNYLNIKS